MTTRELIEEQERKIEQYNQSIIEFTELDLTFKSALTLEMVARIIDDLEVLLEEAEEKIIRIKEEERHDRIEYEREEQFTRIREERLCNEN